MINKLIESYFGILIDSGLSSATSVILLNLSVLIAILILAFIADRLTKVILIRIIGTMVKKTKNTYDDVFLKRKVFQRLAHIAPALVINAGAGLIMDAENLVSFIKIISQLYLILVGTLVVDSFISSLHDIYMQLPISKGRNIKGYVQLVKILLYIIAILVIISLFTEKSIGGLLAGLGAFAAVLMLIFKDTILGLVASIQLSGNKMVSVGDWISMPKYDADGDVIDISLNTVKVQNWDKTIATIPTYALVTNSFNNWKGMEESGGRRIKRSINIDMQSVKFLNNDMLMKFREIRIMTPYIDKQLKVIEEFNKNLGTDSLSLINGRRLTNLGTFRKYLELYLKNNPNINKDMTFLIRHLQPTEIGLPIEIYVFSKDQRWTNYEAIQADIFDHILAVIPEFGLRVFQNPTGEDWKQLRS